MSEEEKLKAMKLPAIFITLLFSIFCILARGGFTTSIQEKVVGEYEIKKDGYPSKQVFLENGIYKYYFNAPTIGLPKPIFIQPMKKPREGEGKWKLTKEGELHATYPWKESILVYRINKDGSITLIARYKDGKREEAPKDKQMTFKKVK